MIAAGPRSRFTELGLLLWVALLILFGFIAVSGAALSAAEPAPIGITAALTPSALVIPATFVALAIALHVFLVARGFRGDQILLPLALALTAIGLVEVERLAPETLLVQQLTWTVVAAGVFVVAILWPRDLATLARYKYSWALLGLALLALPMLPVVGRDINGARIWIHLGPVSFEPLEVVKVFLVVFFAAYLEEHRELLAAPPRRFGPLRLPPIPYLLPIVLMWGLGMAVMVLQNDIGATLILFVVFVAMLYFATGRWEYSLVGLLLLLVGSWGAIEIFRHVRVRVDIWLTPFSNDLRFGPSYQLIQGLFALGNAGLIGAGLGNGMPERIPVVWSDFVFNAFTEEVGFLGALALLALYLVLVFRGMAISLRAPTPFLQLLAAGLSFTLAFQTLVIVAGNAKLIPLTGVTLPFVSYGGSSLVTNFLIIALLLRISDATARVRGGSG
ncbi:MAG: FtsW/RodA/SpoVE family cell cycle protein [Chloroflexota bacterium]|nr:FtsW/RodA/SpoVE family cell cycle protein [Chloroflexota bacterium]